MADTKELKKIKKIYGERFAHLCRDMFPTILESEGKLLTILEETFSHNCNSLYESIIQNHLEIDFKDLIYSKFDKEREEQEIVEVRTPYEILGEAGYDLYECKTERDIQKFRKYYAKGEVLCTIYNGGRLITRDCFFAVKKDVDEIKRKDFQNPQKNDEYSTSVLGIQFTREKNSHVQIISRYNHTVSNPNCTLNNDLDKLAPGLKQSFANLLEERGMNINVSHTKSLFEIPGYTLARDGKYYKYNMEIDGNYYCPGNIIILNGMSRQVIEPEKGIIIDYFLLDLENKAITNLTNLKREKFQEGLQDIDKIQVKTSTDKKSKIIEIYLKDKEKPVVIGIDSDNQITRYENQYLQKVGDTFLYRNGALAELNLPQLQEIGDAFLFHNKALTKISLPQLQKVGDDFLVANRELTELNLPRLQEVGDGFLDENRVLTELNLPQLQEVGDGFLDENRVLTELNLPRLQEVGDGFLFENRALTEVNFPQLQKVGDNFLYKNEVLTELNLPRLQEVGDGFLDENRVLTELNLPRLQEVGDSFLYTNRALTEVNLPQLQKVGDDFLTVNKELTEVNLPKLQEVGDNFLYENRELTEVNLPQLQEVGDGFLDENRVLTEVNLPQLEKVGDNFLYENRVLTELNLPQLQEVGADFLYENRELTEVNLPQLEKVGRHFLSGNKALTKVNLPKIPELESKLKKIAIKNQPKKKEITPTDIAVLDRKSELTTSEIEDAKNNRKIEKISKNKKDVSR